MSPMPNYVKDNTALAAAKKNFQTRPDVPADKKVTNDDWNEHRQFLEDIRLFLREQFEDQGGGTWGPVGGGGGGGGLAVGSTFAAPLTGISNGGAGPDIVNALANHLYIVDLNNDNGIDIRLPSSPAAGDRVLICVTFEGGFSGGSFDVTASVDFSKMFHNVQQTLNLAGAAGDIARHEFVYDGANNWLHIPYGTGL